MTFLNDSPAHIEYTIRLTVGDKELLMEDTFVFTLPAPPLGLPTTGQTVEMFRWYFTTTNSSLILWPADIDSLVAGDVELTAACPSLDMAKTVARGLLEDLQPLIHRHIAFWAGPPPNEDDINDAELRGHRAHLLAPLD